jgi:hypothetical protein
MTVIAYLDPGTGSMVAAAIAGAGASVAVAFKAGWHKTLGRKKGAAAIPEDATPAAADAEQEAPQP